MIQVQQLKLPVGHKENALLEALISKLHVKKDEILSFEVAKRSLDARKKPELFYSYVVNVQVKNQAAVLKRKPKNTIPFEKKLYQLPSPLKESPSRRPVIIGSGPAGLCRSGPCPSRLPADPSGKRRFRGNAPEKGGSLLEHRCTGSGKQCSVW